MTTVALLGASGQIARGLIEDLPPAWSLVPFSRNPDRPHREAAARGVRVSHYDRFVAGKYDLVINAAGPGDPSFHRSKGTAILRITEAFDNMVLDFVGENPGTAYINLSTGAVYGPDYGFESDAPAYGIDVNDLAHANAYVLSKIAAETKHRQSPNLMIADLRVFGYFSRRIDLSSHFFMAQVAAHLLADRPFRTGPADFVRDFIAAEDLAAHIEALQASGVPNAAFNAVSAAPVTKFEILEALGERFGLRYSVDGGEPVRRQSPHSLGRPRDGVQGPALASRITSLQVVLREVGALCAGADRRG